MKEKLELSGLGVGACCSYFESFISRQSLRLGLLDFGLFELDLDAFLGLGSFSFGCSL